MSHWIRRGQVSIQDFRELLLQDIPANDYPHAEGVEKRVLIYDGAALTRLARGSSRPVILEELYRVLAEGPGVFVIKGAYSDLGLLDRANEVFDAIVLAEKARGDAPGDHYAPAGQNERIWNSLAKLAHRDPDLFVKYFSNELIALSSEAWLGPEYQITAQVNIVLPGGTSQVLHRDYHLGFFGPDYTERYPRHVHRLSPLLTLQGAVAHSNMPLESGPTMLVPNSQRCDAGYVIMWDPQFIDVAREFMVQIPMEKGDAIFFSPALLHGAGTNHTSDIRRCANLLQISSPFGKPTEYIDFREVALSAYDSLLEARDSMSKSELACAIAACTDAYPFPTCLDLDKPIGGLAPPSMREIIVDAIAAGQAKAHVVALLDSYQSARRATAS